MKQVADELLASSPDNILSNFDNSGTFNNLTAFGISNDIPEAKNKTQLAKVLGISRGMLYYQHQQPLFDETVRKEIIGVLSQNPYYGHRRIAWELGYNKKRVRRVMKKYGIKTKRRKSKTPRKVEDENQPKSKYTNLIKNLCPMYPNVIWVADFTYIKFHGRFVYLATVVDLYTREVTGWAISRRHDRDLILEALTYALDKTKAIPIYLHSDQGGEYKSTEHITLAESLGIQISMSNKGSPWENGNQESWYSTFKLEFENPNRFNTLGELIEAIYQNIHYYNNTRLHSVFRMAPSKVKQQFDQGVRIQPRVVMNKSKMLKILKNKKRKEKEEEEEEERKRNTAEKKEKTKQLKVTDL